MPKDEIQEVQTYSYDSCGNMALQVFLGDYDTMVYFNEYDRDCRLIKVTEVQGDKTYIKKEHRYDKNGWLSESWIYGNKRTYMRDSCGMVLTETWYAADTIKRQWRNTYDNFGRLMYQEIEPATEYYPGSEVGTCETAIYTYNEKGQILRHYAYFGDSCMGGYYMDLEYAYYDNSLLKGAYWYGQKDAGMILEYLYQYHR